MRSFPNYLFGILSIVAVKQNSIAQSAGNINKDDVSKAAYYILNIINAAPSDAGAGVFAGIKGKISSRNKDEVVYNVAHLTNRFSTNQYLIQRSRNVMNFYAHFLFKPTAIMIEAIKNNLSVIDTSLSFQYNSKSKMIGVYKYIISRNGKEVAVFKNDKYRNTGTLIVPGQ